MGVSSEEESTVLTNVQWIKRKGGRASADTGPGAFENAK